MRLLCVFNEQEVEADIDLLSLREFSAIAKSKRFEFDWLVEAQNHVYKIFLIESGLILGLISLIDMPHELRVNINLIEISSENVGKKKEYDRIAGCLIAFAAKTAFMQGYNGFVSLLPKTQIIDLYCDRYGFQQYGRYLAVEGTSAISLIQTYLKHD